MPRLSDIYRTSGSGNDNSGVRLSDLLRNRFKYRGPQDAGLPSAREFAEAISASGVPVVSDAASGALALADAYRGNYGSAAVNAIGVLPFIGSTKLIKYGKGFDENSVKDLISSQRYLDRDVVAKKIKEQDFVVNVTPEFEINGETFRAITDGHHSLEAARRSKNTPTFIVDTQTTNDKIGLLKKPDDYLESAFHDSPWYRWSTGKDVW